MLREWSASDTARMLRVPGPDDNKYSRGVVALRTGSAAYPGAAVLGVEGAWRAGAGFVWYVGTAADAVLARRPETVVGEPTRVDAWVIGSGTDVAEHGTDEERMLRRILAGPTPVVADAGALEAVVGATAPLIVTPHAGEFARLRARLRLAPDVAADDEGRAAQAAEVASALACTVLLKGARTVITAPEGPAIVVGNAPGWLATAGSGDVLAGILGALVAGNKAQGERDAPLLAEIAAGAAWLHGQAARIASGAHGQAPGHPIVALDVAEAVPRSIATLLA